MMGKRLAGDLTNNPQQRFIAVTHNHESRQSHIMQRKWYRNSWLPSCGTNNRSAWVQQDTQTPADISWINMDDISWIKE